MTVIAPFGGWRSPITPDMVAGAPVALWTCQPVGAAPGRAVRQRLLCQPPDQARRTASGLDHLESSQHAVGRDGALGGVALRRRFGPRPGAGGGRTEREHLPTVVESERDPPLR